MKTFFKVIAIILLSIITTLNIVLLGIIIYGGYDSLIEAREEAYKKKEIAETRAYFKDKETSLDGSTLGNYWDGEYLFNIETVDEMEKYLKELEIVHVYNSKLTVTHQNSKSYTYYEIATFDFKTKLWINPYYCYYNFKINEDLLPLTRFV